MINRQQSIRVRKYATREMLYNESKHAVYGFSYIDESGDIVEKLAENPDKIKYFYNDNSYMNYISLIQMEFKDDEQLDIYVIHRKDFD